VLLVIASDFGGFKGELPSLKFDHFIAEAEFPLPENFQGLKNEDF
jgi:hypothetical protein